MSKWHCYLTAFKTAYELIVLTSFVHFEYPFDQQYFISQLKVLKFLIIFFEFTVAPNNKSFCSICSSWRTESYFSFWNITAYLLRSKSDYWARIKADIYRKWRKSMSQVYFNSWRSLDSIIFLFQVALRKRTGTLLARNLQRLHDMKHNWCWQRI